MFEVNVRGTWLCCKAVAPSMKAARGGRIVNVSSMTVPGGIPLFLHYVASKAAIVGLTRALARELGEFGIAVNAIAPDYVPHDEAYASQQPEMAAALARQRCFQRDMTPDDLVGTLRYLVGPGSSSSRARRCTSTAGGSSPACRELRGHCGQLGDQRCRVERVEADPLGDLLRRRPRTLAEQVAEQRPGLRAPPPVCRHLAAQVRAELGGADPRLAGSRPSRSRRPCRPGGWRPGSGSRSPVSRSSYPSGVPPSLGNRVQKSSS